MSAFELAADSALIVFCFPAIMFPMVFRTNMRIWDLADEQGIFGRLLTEAAMLCYKAFVPLLSSTAWPSICTLQLYNNVVGCKLRSFCFSPELVNVDEPEISNLVVDVHNVGSECMFIEKSSVRGKVAY